MFSLIKWREYSEDRIIEAIIPPDAEAEGFDDRAAFFDALVYALECEKPVHKNEEGKTLLEILSKKWPEAVEESMEKAKTLATKIFQDIENEV